MQAKQHDYDKMITATGIVPGMHSHRKQKQQKQQQLNGMMQGSEEEEGQRDEEEGNRSSWWVIGYYDYNNLYQKNGFKIFCSPRQPRVQIVASDFVRPKILECLGSCALCSVAFL
jgi:hypothetical protein